MQAVAVTRDPAYSVFVSKTSNTVQGKGPCKGTVQTINTLYGVIHLFIPRAAHCRILDLS